MGYTYDQLTKMGAVPGPASGSAPAPAKKSYSYADLMAQGAKPAAAPAAPAAPSAATHPGILKTIAKSLIGPTLTLAARPVQLGAEVLGAKAEDVDKFSDKYSGGLIAHVPQNGGDVKKDVGRAAETVALGTGAPLAGGALFGAGASLEDGNDLFSAQTALDTALGAGAAGVGSKLLASKWVGKPLLNASGAIIGKITPPIIKEVAAGGAGAIAKFAATHDLPFGISEFTKPASEVIEKATQGFDNAIGGKTAKVAGDYYTGKNEQDLLRPTTMNEPAYAKATAVYNDAKEKGIDLEKVASSRGIIHDKLGESGRYNTEDTTDMLRQEVFNAGKTLVRPALAEAERGVAKVPVSDVRDAMIAKIKNSSLVDPEDRAAMLNAIDRRYGPKGEFAKMHPDGMTLTDLHDARIVAGSKGKYKVGQPASDEVNASRFREEGRTFAKLLDDRAPDVIKGARREGEKTFLLADYLDKLHMKKVPAGVLKKSVRLFAKTAAAVAGGHIGGFPGAIVGSRIGDTLFGSFEAIPNPAKMAVLERLQVEEPEAYKALREYLGPKRLRELGKFANLELPAGGSSRASGPTLFTTPGGVSTPNKQAAIDLTTVEKGNAKAPTTNRGRKSYKDKLQYVLDANGVYTPPGEIKAGRIPKKPKRLNDIKF